MNLIQYFVFYISLSSQFCKRAILAEDGSTVCIVLSLVWIIRKVSTEIREERTYKEKQLFRDFSTASDALALFFDGLFHYVSLCFCNVSVRPVQPLSMGQCLLHSLLIQQLQSAFDKVHPLHSRQPGLQILRSNTVRVIQ